MNNKFNIGDYVYSSNLCRSGELAAISWDGDDYYYQFKDNNYWMIEDFLKLVHPQQQSGGEHEINELKITKLMLENLELFNENTRLKEVLQSALVDLEHWND